jgi:hypothetical protein
VPDGEGRCSGAKAAQGLLASLKLSWEGQDGAAEEKGARRARRRLLGPLLGRSDTHVLRPYAS